MQMRVARDHCLWNVKVREVDSNENYTISSVRIYRFSEQEEVARGKKKKNERLTGMYNVYITILFVPQIYSTFHFSLL